MRRLNFKDDDSCDVGKVILELEVDQETTTNSVGTAGLNSSPYDEYGAAVADNMIVPG